MTRPRCLERGQTYLITRRCSERRFFLCPKKRLTKLATYLLGYAAQRFGIELHAFVFMSNHYHLVLTDSSEEVQLPKFMGWLNQHLAKTVNILIGRQESLWTEGSYNAVVLADSDSVMDKIAYTICNPVSAGLVSKPKKWKGLISQVAKLGDGWIVGKNPRVFFNKERPMPDAVRLVATVPPCFDHLSGAEFRRLVQKRVDDRLAEISQDRKAAGTVGFLGMTAVKKQDWYEVPKTKVVPGKLNPRLACRDRALRIALLENLKQFVSDYRYAREDWCAGDREVKFPVGTYGMRCFHEAQVSPGDGIFSFT